MTEAQRLLIRRNGVARSGYARPVGGLLNQRMARKLLERDGWTMTGGGKHAIKMEKPGHRPITLPHHRGADYGRGLSAAIRKQAGLD